MLDESGMSINMMGDHFYALVSGDRLLLFPNQDQAERYMEQHMEEWENRPQQTYVIYRNSHHGLLEDDAVGNSFTLLLQDNVAKMKQLKVKITIDTKSDLADMERQGEMSQN